MAGLVIAAPQQPTVAVAGGNDRFPVGRIWCVGRNYADHAREMGHDPNAEPPFFFAKPADAVIDSRSRIAYPPATSDFHHEAELVVALGGGGQDLTEAQAAALIWGYAAGNDLTRRDLQAQAKAARRPWEMSKGFDQSALVGPLSRATTDGPPQGSIRCHVNGQLRQEARLSDMIWSVPALMATLSRQITLKPSDLIFTGTPAGVGPLSPGNICVVSIDGLTPAEVSIRDEA